MTQEFSFKYYLKNYENAETYNFKDCFKEKINMLPEKIVSSKKILELLDINDNFEKKIFQNVFSKYFKEKILKNY